MKPLQLDEPPAAKHGQKTKYCSVDKSYGYTWGNLIFPSQMFKCVQTCSKLVQMCSNLFKTRSNVFKHVQTYSKPVKMSSNLFKWVNPNN